MEVSFLALLLYDKATQGRVTGLPSLMIVCLLVVLVGLEGAVWAKGSSDCPSPLTETRRALSCRNANWKDCKPNTVVRNPACVEACRERYVTRCSRLRLRQRRVCQGTLKKLVFCPDLAKTWRSRCAVVSGNAQQVCLRKADVQPCREAFFPKRKRCIQKHNVRAARCEDVLQKRLQACQRVEERQRVRVERRCKHGFAKCIRRCVPMRWPCRRRCFANRLLCIQEVSNKALPCRSSARQLLGECVIQADNQQTRCIRKHQDTMYRCMQKLRRKRIVCMVRVGERYTACIQKSHSVQLRCWFRKMGREYLCSGAALRDCLKDRKTKWPQCQRRCNRCLVPATTGKDSE